MLPRLVAVLPRFVAIAVVCLLASAAVTFAAGNEPAAPPPAATTTVAEPAVLVVPDVRDQAYVFAKGTLEDAGLAWKLEGGAPGYAANVVVEQSPQPGTRVVDTGAPLVTLRLATNPAYPGEGSPEDTSPYPGTRLELAELPTPAPAPAAPVGAAPPKAPATVAPRKAMPKQAAPKQAAPKRAAPKRAASKAKPTPPAATTPASASIAARPPAFAVPGAPSEPLDELSLPERADRLAAYVAAHPEPTNAAAKHWLYQHTWIVTGARFGWWGGVEALERLVALDRRVEQQWGIGARSRRVAAQALAEVRRRSS
jgi:hypothetical protein